MLEAGGTCEFSSQTLRSDRRGAHVAPASARASDPAAPPSGIAHASDDAASPMRTGKTHRLTTCATRRGSEGLPVPREPGYGSKRSQDGEAQRTCSERRARCPTRTSGDGGLAAPSLIHAQASSVTRITCKPGPMSASGAHAASSRGHLLPRVRHREEQGWSWRVREPRSRYCSYPVSPRHYVLRRSRQTWLRRWSG